MVLFKDQTNINSTEPQDPVDYGDEREPYIDSIGDEGNPIYDEINPKFSFKGSNVNLKYNSLLPFIGAYLVFKYLWKI